MCGVYKAFPLCHRFSTIRVAPVKQSLLSSFDQNFKQMTLNCLWVFYFQMFICRKIVDYYCILNCLGADEMLFIECVRYLCHFGSQGNSNKSVEGICNVGHLWHIIKSQPIKIRQSIFYCHILTFLLFNFEKWWRKEACVVFKFHNQVARYNKGA